MHTPHIHHLLSFLLTVWAIDLDCLCYPFFLQLAAVQITTMHCDKSKKANSGDLSQNSQVTLFGFKRWDQGRESLTTNFWYKRHSFLEFDPAFSQAHFYMTGS